MNYTWETLLGKEIEILAAESGLALTATAQGEVLAEAADGKDHQIWHLEQAETGVQIISKLTGKAVDLVALGNCNGTWVQQWEKLAAKSQYWLLEQNEDGCQIQSVWSGKYLDIVGMVKKSGAHLQIWEKLDGNSQKWELKPLEIPKKRTSRKTAKKADTIPEVSKTETISSKTVVETKKTTKSKTSAKKKATEKNAEKSAVSSKTNQAQKTSEKPTAKATASRSRGTRSKAKQL